MGEMVFLYVSTTCRVLGYLPGGDGVQYLILDHWRAQKEGLVDSRVSGGTPYFDALPYSIVGVAGPLL